MRTLTKTLTKTLATLVTAIALTGVTAQAASYQVTVNGKMETVCSASSAAWKLYGAAKESKVEGTIKVIPTTKSCQAAFDARKPKQVKQEVPAKEASK